MKKERIINHKLFIAGAFLDLLILDQITKYFIRFHLEEPIIITDFFRIVFVENTGAAFSLAIPEFLIMTLAILVVGYLGHQFWTQPLGSLERWAYVCIAAGAAGNLIDRFLYGAVTDFLSFWSFPIFNVADSCITLGVGIFLINEIYNTKKKSS